MLKSSRISHFLIEFITNRTQTEVIFGAYRKTSDGKIRENSKCNFILLKRHRIYKDMERTCVMENDKSEFENSKQENAQNNESVTTESEKVNSENVNTENVNTENVNIENVNTENVNIENVNIENGNTENAQNTDNAETTANAEANESTSASRPMTDEEIRAAAEKIGSSPYAAYTDENRRSSSYSQSAEGPENSENSGNFGNNNQKASSGSPYYDYYTTYHAKEFEKKKKNRKVFKKIARFVGLAACFGLIAGTFFGVNTLMENTLGKKLYSDAGVTEIDSAADNTVTTLGANKIQIAQTVTQSGTSETAVTNSVSSSETTSDKVVQVVKDNMSCSVSVSMEYVTSSYNMWTGRTQSYTSTGGGSGFIVGIGDSEIFIATNNHVVENATKITITFCDDTEVEATVRATDSDNDLAIISVPIDELTSDTLNQITVAKLGNSDTAEVGEMVVAIGNALGYGQSVTVGYLSAKDRTVEYEGLTLTLLQTDAAINEGNSGGPLFNLDGEVIGINCAKYSSETVEGMCFAIPISIATPILDELMSREIVSEEEQGYLGINIKTLSSDVASLYGMPEGVYVYSVVDGGSAAEAGIYSGDIITAVNGKEVSTSEELKSLVNSYKYGTTISVTLQRSTGGKWTEMTIDVTLMQKPEETTAQSRSKK